ncbi:MAG: glycosyltransferase [Verrucomicrobia subdivision 3 bacterium]|nr:glycosyltransferase [Limisphaerales bacterium]
MDKRFDTNRSPVLENPEHARALDRSSRKTTRRRVVTRPPSPLISIVVPAHNEERYLPRTLEALRHQTLRDFEIIVVCNGCTDRTTDVARQSADQVIVMPERGLSRARNLGGRAARGGILLFLDADTLLDPGALEKVAVEFSPNFAAGTVRGCPDITRPSYRVMYAIKNFQHRCRLHEGSSGVILCWREHFLAVGGFDETLHVTENSDLIKRLRHFGKYAFISSTCVTTSMRRYENGGLTKMVCLWVKLWFQSLISDLSHQKYEAVR